MSSTTDRTIYRSRIGDPAKAWPQWTAQNEQDLMALGTAITRGDVIAYIGAGPSMVNNGIPGWGGLCRRLLKWVRRTKPPTLTDRDFTHLRQLLRSRNYPLFCQLIDNAYGDRQNELANFLKRTFKSEHLDPPAAYRAIGMLPIALRLTTNYETLFERAIKSLPPAYRTNAPANEGEALTWKNGSEILELVRNRQPAIVKLHGDINGKDGIILTKNHYRSLTSNVAFSVVLKALLSTRTFLFIGCSMTDPDIFALLDEVIEECQLLRSDVARDHIRWPLHYALLSEDSRPEAFVRHLRHDYRIATLPVPTGIDGKPDLVPLLRLIGAAVANETEPAIQEFSPVFDERSARTRLTELVRVTGSDRADLVLIEDEGAHELRRWFNWDLGRSKPSAWKNEPPHNGVILAAFADDGNLLYAPDLKRSLAPGSESFTQVGELGEVPEEAVGFYLNWDDKSRCELAIPITARGNRIGVLNIESYFPDAFSQGHLNFLNAQARKIAAQYLEAVERERLVQSIVPSQDSELRDDSALFLLAGLQQLYEGAEDLRGILYTPSYLTGQLDGTYYDESRRELIRHDPYSNEPSFAAKVFWEREFHLVDAKEAGSINRKAADKVGLRGGPLFGCQVFDRELMCAVLVLWARQGDDEVAFESCRLKDRYFHTVLATAANLIVAGISAPKKTRSPDVKNVIQDVLRKIRALCSASTQAEVYDQVAAAVKALGLNRLRVWRYYGQLGYAEVEYVWPETHRLVRHATESWRAEDSERYSKYCEMTVNRYPTNPWARLQGPKVNYADPDPRRYVLQKPAGSDWIVAPIVLSAGRDSGSDRAEGGGVKLTLWGYLAADVVPPEKQDDYDGQGPCIPVEERNWLQCGMSVVAAAMSSAQRHIRDSKAASR